LSPAEPVRSIGVSFLGGADDVCLPVREPPDSVTTSGLVP